MIQLILFLLLKAIRKNCKVLFLFQNIETKLLDIFFPAADLRHQTYLFWNFCWLRPIVACLKLKNVTVYCGQMFNIRSQFSAINLIKFLKSLLRDLYPKLVNLSIIYCHFSVHLLFVDTTFFNKQKKSCLRKLFNSSTLKVDRFVFLSILNFSFSICSWRHQITWKTLALKQIRGQ